ncbi:xanthine dehydrogenase [Petrotoga mexicana DSM 14811]|uniref:Xanthine dehydrogenase n=2 Tax=Petrotoga TaxID=28236 RepID=A0A2K1P4W5_9BACT|nr:xanthine dehydrogenase [Petrotoga mexicana DSM 14811]
MFNSVNQPKKRIDAYEKVTGKAKFADDLEFPNMLYAKVLRSKYPSARILNIYLDEAKKIPGVKAIITANDIPNNEFGVIIPDQQVLAKERTYFIGDGIAVVAAETPESAKKAVESIKVEYDEISGIFDPLESKNAPSIHEDKDNNQVIHHKLRKGNIEEGFKRCDVILEREYQTQFIEHAYMEPEVVIAVPYENNSVVTIYGSVQNPFACRNAVASVLKIGFNQVRIVQNHIGGSFGGKDEVISSMAARAAVLALKTNRPVKLKNTREESIIESYKRHPYNMRYKVGATKEGKLLAMEIEAIADSGAYACQTPFVTWRSVVQATGPYEIPNVKTDTYGYYTNNVYTGAMRGYGSPQVIFANESLMDELAQELGMNPLDLRLKNIFHDNSETASGQKLDNHKVSLEEVIKKAADSINFLEKYKEYSREQKGDKRKGIGMAISYRGCSLGAEAVDAAGIILSIQKDGTVYLYSGLAENGQGLKTAFSQIVAEELGIDIEKINFMVVDTLVSPDSGSTVASRATLIGGNASLDAAKNLKKKLTDFIVKKYNLVFNELIFKDNSIYTPDQKKIISFDEAASQAYNSGVFLSSYGWYKAPEISWDEETGQGRPYFTYVYGCQIAEVEVDIGTGEIKVLKMVAAHDVGRAINPANVLGQFYGGISMGLGYGIMEELDINEGYINNTNFDEYLIPTVKDMPDITPIIVENPDPNGPYGAKSIGEPTLELGAAAIANAVAQATGKRIRSLPINLEKILVGHSLKKGRKKK